MSEKISVSIKVSKKIYDHIISYFQKTLLSGNIGSLIFDKYKSDDIRPFIYVYFEDFLKGPQDRESLIELLDELCRLYGKRNNYINRYYFPFTYDMSLFDSQVNLCISNKDKILSIQIIDLSNRLFLLRFFFKLSNIQDLNNKLQERQKENDSLKITSKL